jgi:hypothetical protein
MVARHRDRIKPPEKSIQRVAGDWHKAFLPDRMFGKLLFEFNI